MNNAKGAWRKSSFSEPNGGNCVEVNWRKSSFSQPNNGNCVEVAHSAAVVGVRDSKNPDNGRLTVTPGQWAHLVTWLR